MERKASNQAHGTRPGLVGRGLSLGRQLGYVWPSKPITRFITDFISSVDSPHTRQKLSDEKIHRRLYG